MTFNERGMTFTFSDENAGYTSLGIMLLIGLVLAKTIRDNGIFCLTPCGPHACIIDTNSGNAAAISALRTLRNEQELSTQQLPNDIESKVGTTDVPLCEAVRDHADIVTRRLDNHFVNNKVKMCVVM